MIDFDLPNDLIAQEPAHPRDSARLLVYDRSNKKIIDTQFSQLNKFLVTNTSLVVNNSKVENCRWLFDNGKTEIFVLEKLDTQTIRAMVRPGKKFRAGSSIAIAEFLEVNTLSVDKDGIRTLKLNVQHDDPKLLQYEHVPLPPYIAQNDQLADEYQTVYAKPLGSKAAPTAGLHFTEELIIKTRKLHDILEITLHVSLGTFAGLTEENLRIGKLHSESYEIDKITAESIKTAEHITAVGTTSTRTLESLYAQTVQGSTLYSKDKILGETDIFIQPGFEFKRVNSMITNFHLPGTSLLLMVEAFIGSKSEMQRIYDHAIKEKYRFYSFGDAMLII
jgi:S-adenosylmethionine:tRNA ribosyltransferase-isomerase